MKKYVVNLILTTIMLFTYIIACAEGDDENISLEILPVESDIIDVTDEPKETEESVPTENSEKPFLDGEIQTDSDVLELYGLPEPEGDIWAHGASMKEGRADFETIIINDNLYAIGGFGSSGYVNSVEKYNNNTNSWDIVTYIPDTSVKGFSIAHTDDKIYIIGGYKDGVYLNEVQVYNTVSDEWNNATPMLERRDKATSLYIDNKIYVFGGRNARGLVSNYEYYDISTDTWNKVTSGFDDSIIRIGARSKYVNGYVCIYGGLNENYENMGVNVYLASDLTNMTEMLTKGKEYISIAWGLDKALVFFVAENESTYSIKEMVLEEDNPYISSVNLREYPLNMQYTQNVIFNGYLYCMGGYDQTSRSYNTSTYKYSVYYGDYVTGDGQINSVVTADGNTVTLNVEAGKKYMLMVNVNNISRFDGYTFTIEYPENSFSIIDCCMFTDDRNTSVNSNNIQGTDIRITEVGGNGLSFVSSETIPDGKKISETVNAVLLRASSSGQRTIKYSMTK